MIETLKDHWSFIIVLGTGLVWSGRVKAALETICAQLRDHGREIASLRKELQGFQQKADCMASQGVCQGSIRRAFDEYRQQFSADIQEIKQMIYQMDEKREESRRELFQLFREIDEKREVTRREMMDILRQVGHIHE